jgi:hypothetical protein
MIEFQMRLSKTSLLMTFVTTLASKLAFVGIHVTPHAVIGLRFPLFPRVAVEACILPMPPTQRPIHGGMIEYIGALKTAGHVTLFAEPFATEYTLRVGIGMTGHAP